jgi:hypothetical protein
MTSCVKFDCIFPDFTGVWHHLTDISGTDSHAVLLLSDGCIMNVLAANTALDPVKGYADPKLSPHGFLRAGERRSRTTQNENGSINIQKGGTKTALSDVTGSLNISETKDDDVIAVADIVPRKPKFELPKPIVPEVKKPTFKRPEIAKEVSPPIVPEKAPEKTVLLFPKEQDEEITALEKQLEAARSADEEENLLSSLFPDPVSQLLMGVDYPEHEIPFPDPLKPEIMRDPTAAVYTPGGNPFAVPVLGTIVDAAA